MISGTIIRSDSVICRRVNDDLVIISESGEQICVLNQTASIIWEMLDGEIGINKIAAHLSERFDVSIEKASTDTTNIIQSFLTNGIALQV